MEVGVAQRRDGWNTPRGPSDRGVGLRAHTPERTLKEVSGMKKWDDA